MVMEARCFVLVLLVTASFILQPAFIEGRHIQSFKGSDSAMSPRGTVKTIEGDDGEIVDCVDIYKQPAFDHPLLKNHKLQMEPSNYPKGRQPTSAMAAALRQSWQNNGECPDRTIPIIRRQFKPDAPIITRKPANTTLAKPSTTSTNPHQYSVVQYFAQTTASVRGAHATINVWNPTVNKTTDFSLTQIWVFAGSGSNVNTMEAGWQVYPARTGDNKTRFFIYWTRDDYNTTGCYDLACPGFVQNNKQMAIGAPLNVSTYNGQQVEMDLVIDRDNSTGNWWLYLNNQSIGYWPASIFTALAKGADGVEWGGEILDSSGSGGAHTLTQMGSGHFANEGYRNASYVTGIRYKNATSNQVMPSPLYQLVTMPSCYNMQAYNTGSDYVVFYGGPGCK
ncbi:hypothetical protein Ancab_019341 [Ancistrocladus abbreviatus]